MRLMPSAQSLLTTTRETWEREYADYQVIPTSTRTSPSRSVLLFENFFSRDRPLRILDAGSGNGRNALYLARKGHTIHALDFVDQPLSDLRRAVEREQLKDQVLIVESSLDQVLPFKPSFFDLVLDSYVSCHFLNVHLRKHFISEIDRVLRPGGHLFSSQFAVDDEYYRELIPSFPSLDPVVQDPRNRISKQLYSDETARSIFSSLGMLQYFAKFEFSDFVIDRVYRRSVFVLLVEKEVA